MQAFNSYGVEGSYSELDREALIDHVLYSVQPDGTCYVVGTTAPVEYAALDFITIDGKRYDVVVVTEMAFYNEKKLKSITLGKSLKKIKRNAFGGCESIKTIYLDEGCDIYKIEILEGNESLVSTKIERLQRS